MVCEWHLNNSVIKKACVPRLLDIVGFQETRCPRIRLATYNRKPPITVDYIREVSFCVAFCFYSWKKKEAGGLGLVHGFLDSQRKLRVSLSSSCTMPAGGFYSQGQFIVQDGCWSGSHSSFFQTQEKGRREVQKEPIAAILLVKTESHGLTLLPGRLRLFHLGTLLPCLKSGFIAKRNRENRYWRGNY